MSDISLAVIQERKHLALVLGEIGLVRSLGEMGIPLLVGSELKENIATRSRYAIDTYIFSEYCSKKFIDELCELGKYFRKKPVIFSDDDRALLNISRNRERLEEYYLFLYPEKEVVNSILDKQDFAELSEQHDLPVPESYKAASANDVKNITPHVKFPCIIKPIQRHYWWGKKFIEKVGFYQKAIKCSTLEEFEEMYEKIAQVNPGVVIQEYIEGDDNRHYSANLFVNNAGILMGHFIARKRRIYPIKAGTGTYIETMDNDDVLDISLDVIRKLGLKGLVNIQFKQDSQTGEYKLLEIHARNSLWSLLGAKAGANLSYSYYNYLVNGNENDSPLKANPNVKYFNLPKDIRALQAYRKEGIMTLTEWLHSLKGEKVFAVLSARDIKPALFLVWYFASARLKLKRKKVQSYSEWRVKKYLRYSNYVTKYFYR